MGSGMYLTDLLPQFEAERRADPAEPVDESTVQAIETQLAEEVKELGLWLRGEEGDCFYPIRDLDAPEEREFLDQVGRMIAEADVGFVPFIGPKDLFKGGTLEDPAIEERKAVLAFVKRCVAGQR